jgi:hypothetical protein
VRRTITGSLAFLTMTGTLLVLPVYAAPGPEPQPVEVTADEVDLGSVAQPAPEADVQEGTTDPVRGVPDTTPALTVRETDTDEFSMVSVSWAYDAAVVDTVVQVRVQDEDGDWGEWTEVGTEDATPDTGADPAAWRGGTSPLWTGPSHGVEAELVTRSGARPTDVRLSLVDPGDSDTDSVTQQPDIASTAEAATALPPVHSRLQWGADERYATWEPEYAPTIKAATVHHTASGNGYTAEDVPKILRGIYYAHAVSNGWGDIGYNVLVDRFGRLWEGRKGGLASTVIGAHAGGWNTGTFGVSMIGNYDLVDTPQPMIDAVAAIISWKLALYGVDPNGTAQLTGGCSGCSSRYKAGTTVTVPTVFAHRDTNSTACPGRYGFARMGEIRTLAGRGSAAASLVKGLYQDVLGRAPAETELASWTRRVVESGDRWVAVRGFSNSEEYRRRFIAEAYHQILGRSPDPAGVDFWNAQIATGRSTLDRLRSEFMASREFYLQGGGSDEGFVEHMYQRSFGRSASAAERRLWASTIRTEGRPEAIRGIWDSYESALHRVDRGYQRWLGRAASPSEQDYWSGMVVRKGDESMREAALVSPEYLARAMSRFP